MRTAALADRRTGGAVVGEPGEGNGGRAGVVSAGPLRVVLVDGQRLFREGMRALLQRSPRLRVVADAASTPEALAKVQVTAPEVVVTAFVLPGEAPGALLRELREVCPEVPVVVLTEGEAEETLLLALQAGAQGVVLKDAAPELVVKAVQAVGAGEVWVQREAMQHALGRLRHRPLPEPGPKLSVRESEVLQLLATGASTHEIADQLFISPSTVRVHIAGFFHKLQVRNRIEAVRKALKEGLVEA